MTDAETRALFLATIAANSIKISALPSAASVDLDDYGPMNQSGSTKTVTYGKVLGAVVGRAITYQNLRDLTVANIPDGSVFSVSGVTAENDGGEGSFYYDSTSVAAVNLGTILQPTSGAGRFIRLFSGDVNLKWFGAKGDYTTDDTVAVQAAIDYAAPTGLTLYAPSGRYGISDTLTIPLIAGEATIHTVRIRGDGGSYRWNGAGTQFVVHSSLLTFPQPMLTLNLSRFTVIEGIRFKGLGKTDTGSVAVLFNNQNQGSIFTECGFEGWATGIQVGDAAIVSPGNDDFAKYNLCEWLNCDIFFDCYGTQAYQHKVYRSMMHGATYGIYVNKDGSNASMNSVSIYDSFLDVSDTVVFVEGNPSASSEIIGNLFEGTYADQPTLYDQSEGAGSFDSSITFARNQINWGGFGVTQRPFIKIYGTGICRFEDNLIGCYRPLVYASSIIAEACPLVCLGNKWMNRPGFFDTAALLGSAQAIQIGDTYRYGQALTAADAFGVTNAASTARWGLEYGERKLVWRDKVTWENIRAGSVLIGATPGSANSPAIEFVTDYGTLAAVSTTADTTNGSPNINVASADGLYIGAYLFITGDGVRTVKHINGTAVTLNQNAVATLTGAALVTNGLPRTGIYLKQAAIPTASAFSGSFAIHADAAPGEPSFWINPGTGVLWIPGGIAGAIQGAAVADAAGWADATAQTKFNALLAVLRTSKLIAT